MSTELESSVYGSKVKAIYRVTKFAAGVGICRSI